MLYCSSPLHVFLLPMSGHLCCNFPRVSPNTEGDGVPWEMPRESEPFPISYSKGLNTCSWGQHKPRQVFKGCCQAEQRAPSPRSGRATAGPQQVTGRAFCLNKAKRWARGRGLVQNPMSRQCGAGRGPAPRAETSGMLLEPLAWSNCSIAGRKPSLNHNPNGKAGVLQGSPTVWEQDL